MVNEDLQRAMSVDHIGVDLWQAMWAYEEAMFKAISDAGYDVTLADSDVLAFVGPRGTWSSEIARSRRITKQAAQEQVQRLAARGYLEIGPDPEDRRAKRVTLTPRGQAMMRDFVRIKDGLHRRVIGAIGQEEANRLRRVLATITTVLG